MIIRPRTILVIVLAILLAGEISRLTIANSVFSTQPTLAEALAPGLPVQLASSAMAGVGTAAAQGGLPSRQTLKTLNALARAAPLSIQPLLVQGAIAEESGDLRRADLLLLLARKRDPRSSAARFLLADVWFREGRVGDGLAEIGNLSRLWPEARSGLISMLAQYASSPSTIPEVAEFLRANPELKDPLLTALATSSDNTAVILRLDAVASQAHEQSAMWKPYLLNTLVEAGKYDRAFSLWRRFARAAAKPESVFNSGYQPSSAPPPFNWSYLSGPTGIVEPKDGRLHVLYYGQEDSTLASELLLLKSGSYVLNASASGAGQPDAIEWTVTCVGSATSILNLALAPGKSIQGSFSVPADKCEAQKLELVGRSKEVAADSDLLIGPVTIRRVGQ